MWKISESYPENRFSSYFDILCHEKHRIKIANNL